MNRPEIKILSVSNVYSRMMIFHHKGDYEVGHYHNYDHGTLIAKGSVEVSILNDDDSIKLSKVFIAPNFVFINKHDRHLITALEDNSLAVCIHALRTIDEDIIAPDFFIDQKELQDFDGHKPGLSSIGEEMRDKGLLYKTLSVDKNIDIH